MADIRRAIAAEALGSAMLFACVVGSGIMAEGLAGGNDAVALLGNTLATAAMLFVLISILGPVSGAHLNPAVTLVMRLRHEISSHRALLYVVVQLAGGVAGIWLAHAMFDQPLIQISDKARSSPGQWLGEGVATFMLILTIFGAIRYRPQWVAPAVAMVIMAGYWFTSSTSFANPAISIARSLSDSFAGIAPSHVPAFIAAQIAGALMAWATAKWLFDDGNA